MTADPLEEITMNTPDTLSRAVDDALHGRPDPRPQRRTTLGPIATAAARAGALAVVALPFVIFGSWPTVPGMLQ